MTNYNNSDHTISLFNSLKKDSSLDFFMVVVDNQSNQSSIAELRCILSEDRVKVIFEKRNLGYFGGLNVGIEWARERQRKFNFDLWLVGNNDLRIDRDFSSGISAASDTFSKYPVVSPDIVTLDGTHQNPHVINSISPFREFIYDIYHYSYPIAKLVVFCANLSKIFTDRKDELQHDYAQEIYQGYGACYFLTKAFFEIFDSLPNCSFLMYEEFFLSKQLSDHGLKMFYEPRLKILHYCKGSTGLIPRKKMWEFSREAHLKYRRYVGIFGNRKG